MCVTTNESLDLVPIALRSHVPVTNLHVFLKQVHVRFISNIICKSTTACFLIIAMHWQATDSMTFCKRYVVMHLLFGKFVNFSENAKIFLFRSLCSWKLVSPSNNNNFFHCCMYQYVILWLKSILA